MKKYNYLCYALVCTLSLTNSAFTQEPDTINIKRRIETDSLGQIEVPDGSYWGAQTQRALEHFAIGNQYFTPDFIHAYAMVKKAAAITNYKNGYLAENLYSAIAHACDEIIAGKLDNQFPTRVWQSAGTQINMNVNEVISNRANEILGAPLGSKKPVHPNDHVNMAQSTNDTIPTVVNVAATIATTQHLLPAIKVLQDAFAQKAIEFQDILKSGRTHTQDAVPMSVGQEFGAFAQQVADAYTRINQNLTYCYELALGGTAVGTGITAYPAYANGAAQELANITGLPFTSAQNKFCQIAAHDSLVAFSGAVKSLAVALFKIASDLRWLSSGPRTGLAEIKLPANEPGSSIMPAKVNPTQCDAMRMICAYVIGNDAMVTWCCANGEMQLNVNGPLMGYAILNSIHTLADACISFTKHCVQDIQVNRERVAFYLEHSLMLTTALSPKIGYDKAAKVAQKALAENKTLKQAAVELGYLTAEQFDQYVQPKLLITPGR